jgi:hypothetical protein
MKPESFASLSFDSAVFQYSGPAFFLILSLCLSTL